MRREKDSVQNEMVFSHSSKSSVYFSVTSISPSIKKMISYNVAYLHTPDLKKTILYRPCYASILIFP